MAYISQIKLPDGTIYDIKGITYSIKLSDDGKSLILTGSDGKTSSVAIGLFSIKKPSPYFSDVFKIL